MLFTCSLGPLFTILAFFALVACEGGATTIKSRTRQMVAPRWHNMSFLIFISHSTPHFLVINVAAALQIRRILRSVSAYLKEVA